MKATIAAFNDVLRRVAAETGAGYVPVDETAFSRADFIDNGHFTIEGADKFARLVGPAIVKTCQ